VKVPPTSTPIRAARPVLILNNIYPFLDRFDSHQP
jgi:hypothetical protein